MTTRLRSAIKVNGKNPEPLLIAKEGKLAGQKSIEATQLIAAMKNKARLRMLQAVTKRY